MTRSPTIPSNPFVPHKVKLSNTPPSPPPQQNTATAATLRPLYGRAVRAFLHRDIVLTHSLLASAFALITPPLTGTPDSLSEHRRKSNALLSGAALLASLHSRSIRLFAPLDCPTPNPAFLPPTVLITLALSSAKIGYPDAGRGIIEEWLACRLPIAVSADNGYEKVLEVYCLSILSALGEWTYAKQFLAYETELPAQNRERLASSLASLHEQYLASLIREPSPSPSSSAPATPKPTSPTLPSTSAHSPVASASTHSESSSAITPTPSRPSSPSPSSSSASSNSTQTAVPTNPRLRASTKLKHGALGNGHALTPLTSTLSTTTATTSSSSSSSHVPPTPHDVPTSSSSSRAMLRGRAASPVHQSQTPPRQIPTIAIDNVPDRAMSVSGSSSGTWSMLIDSLRSTLGPYARHAPLFLLFVVLPALAMLLRFWRRRPKSIALPSSSATAAAAAATIVGAGGAMATTRTRAVEDVRRRLSGVQARRGLLSVVWDETVRAIWDTIAMGGRGLV
ncbi:hypothetical protein BGW80DRAFT_1255485 [Lactifluus volemus]|nr:hypothetical protein BGW80DRAFT_1255485 [Lactifluus volemus]